MKCSGKGCGYQGTCFKCGRVGHKAAECGWWVNEVDETAKGEGGKEGDVGGLWVVAGVEEDGHRSKHDWNGGCCGGVAAAGPPLESVANAGSLDAEEGGVGQQV